MPERSPLGKRQGLLHSTSAPGPLGVFVGEIVVVIIQLHSRTDAKNRNIRASEALASNRRQTFSELP